MIAHIDDFEILLCETNLEALILECNLIKLHKPYYNILLKDDKHYPYLKVDMRQPASLSRGWSCAGSWSRTGRGISGRTSAPARCARCWRRSAMFFRCGRAGRRCRRRRKSARA